jgi:uncharacterized membrane protein (DUF485 family)
MDTPRPGPAPELVTAARALTRERLRFSAPVGLATLGVFLVITVVAGFTTILNVQVIGPVTLFTALMVLGFPVVGLFAYAYTRRAAAWDDRTAEVLAAALAEQQQRTEAGR